MNSTVVIFSLILLRPLSSRLSERRCHLFDRGNSGGYLFSPTKVLSCSSLTGLRHRFRFWLDQIPGGLPVRVGAVNVRSNNRVESHLRMGTERSALWRDMMEYLRSQHGPICRQWFEQLAPGELDGGLLTVHTVNGVQTNYLQNRCVKQFSEAAQAATGALVAVQFVDGKTAQTDRTPDPKESDHLSSKPIPLATDTPPRQPPPAPVPRRPSPPARPTAENRTALPPNEDDSPFDQIVINPDYSFDNFVTGPENALAYSTAVAVANQPGTDYNPLFIHGGVGLGKTHLLQAICQSVLEIDPDMRICYLSCDSFVNQFLDCIQRSQMSQFRYRYRHVDLLVIDDIHFLANRERTQEEFFHTFNELHQLKRQIVLSSDSPPHEIPQLEDRIVSRFQSGMVAPVAKAKYETRVAIVRAKTALRQLTLPNDVISYIATRIDSNARELEGAITTLQGYIALQNIPIDLDLAKVALGESPVDARPNQITLQHVIDAVTKFYNVRLSDLQSKRRQKSITSPRQICMWLSRRHTSLSLEEIGGSFGGRDHTTVMHSIKIVDQQIAVDAAFAKQVEQIEARIVDHR